MTEKGIFTKEQEKAIAKYLDEQFEFKNKFVEAVDGVAFKYVIAIVDDYGLDNIPDTYKHLSAQLGDALIAEDLAKSAGIVFELATLIIKNEI